MNETMNADMEKTAIGLVDNGERTQMVSQPSANATQLAVQVNCPVCQTANPPSETYCIDCGFLLSAAPVAVAETPSAAAGTLVSSDGAREFPLKPGENSVGRQNADVLLDNNTVSRKHARVIVENGCAYVEDSGSSNGTSVDGKKIASGERIAMADGSEVSFGSCVVKYKAPEPSAAPAEPESAEPAEETAAPEQTVEIEAQTGAEPAEIEAPGETEEEGAAPESAEPVIAGRLVSVDGSMAFPLAAGVNKVGRRAGENDIVISDPYCSGRHADLLAEAGAFTLTDNGSTNGTMVNGVKLEPNAPLALQPGDEITFGQIVFKIEVA